MYKQLLIVILHSSVSANSMESCMYILHLEQFSIKTVLILSSPWPSVAGGCGIASVRMFVCVCVCVSWGGGGQGSDQ